MIENAWKAQNNAQDTENVQNCVNSLLKNVEEWPGMFAYA